VEALEAVAASATKEEVGLEGGKAVIRADLPLPTLPVVLAGEVATEEEVMTTDATDMVLREIPAALREATETLSADAIVDTKSATGTATEIVIGIGTGMAEAAIEAETETEAEADARTTMGPRSDTTTMMGTTTRDKDGGIEPWLQTRRLVPSLSSSRLVGGYFYALCIDTIFRACSILSFEGKQPVTLQTSPFCRMRLHKTSEKFMTNGVRIRHWHW